jgi:transaldolase
MSAEIPIFIDTADIEDVRTWNRRGIIGGVTTNQNIFLKQLDKEGRVDFKETILEICKEVNGPVSVELTGHENVERMVKEAQEYAGWHKNVIIKVPMTPDGIGLDVVRRLKDLGIRTNMTIMMTAEQLILAAQAGATYISIFYNRSKDAELDPIREIQVAKKYIEEAGLDSKIIAGSLRKSQDVGQAIEAGADVVTIPSKVLVEMLQHKMTDQTIAEFDKSWQKFQQALKAAETAAPKTR